MKRVEAENEESDPNLIRISDLVQVPGRQRRSVAEPSTVTPVGVRTQRSVRKIIREFVNQQIAGESEIQTSEVVARVYEHFKDDEEFIAAAVRDIIQQVVPQLLSEQFTRRRTAWVTTATGAVSRRRLEDTVRERLGKVFENANGKYHVFLDMRRPDLLAAAESRERRIAGESRWASLERDTAALLPNDSETVGACLSDKQLVELVERHFKPAE